jgi:hypothetical protein
MVIEMGLKTKRIGMFSGLLVLMSILVASACASAQEDLPWSNETDVIILPWSNETDVIIIPSPPLPPFFSDFSITPTEIVLGEDLAISFVIRNPNNQTITRMSATRIGDFFTQIIEIRLEAYESKFIYYRIIPHVVGEYDVWIDGQTGTFKVIPPTPLPPSPVPVNNETDVVIIVVDPLEELNMKIKFLNTHLQDLIMEFSPLQMAHLDLTEEVYRIQTAYTVDMEELNAKIDLMETTLETYSNEVNEEIVYLENKISSLQSTILFAYIAIAASVIGGFYFIKRMR